MCEKLAERKRREMEIMESARGRKGTVSDSELFTRANKLVKVVKN